MSSRQELEAAAADVIKILKGIDEFKEASIAVIGGLALWKYIPYGRTTEDVDFIINCANAPDGVKQKLLRLPDSPFVQYAELFYYKNPRGQQIQIDITPHSQSLYMPANAAKVKNIPDQTVPYVSVTDLIVFKIYSCGSRAQQAKRRIDVSDAEALVLRAVANTPLRLTNWQKDQLEPCISDLVKYGRQDEGWWRKILVMPAKK